MSITEEIKQHLSNLPTLTVTTSNEVFQAVSSKLTNPNYGTVREALQKLSFGSPTSERRNTQKFFALYLGLQELNEITKRKSDVYLSVPGIEKDYVQRMSSNEVKRIQSTFDSAYGSQTISFWVKRSQLNAGVSETVKDKVRVRDNYKCRICTTIENIFVGAGRGLPSHIHKHHPKVCHIISRRSIFWHILNELNQKHKTIFCDDAVTELKQKVKQNHLFSRAEFLVYLCKLHDDIVQDALKK